MEEKLTRMKQTSKYLDSFVAKGSNNSLVITKKHIASSIESLETLSLKYPNIGIKTSCLSTRVVENFFSIIKSKNRYPSVFENQIHSKACFVLQYRFSNPEQRLVTFAPVSVGNNYGDQHGVEFDLPDITFQSPTEYALVNEEDQVALQSAAYQTQ